MDENLAENLSFVLDAILDDVDEPYAETLEAALTLAQFSWNNTVHENHTKIDACITQLDNYKTAIHGFGSNSLDMMHHL